MCAWGTRIRTRFRFLSGGWFLAVRVAARQCLTSKRENCPWSNRLQIAPHFVAQTCPVLPDALNVALSSDFHDTLVAHKASVFGSFILRPAGQMAEPICRYGNSVGHCLRSGHMLFRHGRTEESARHAPPSNWLPRWSQNIHSGLGRSVEARETDRSCLGRSDEARQSDRRCMDVGDRNSGRMEESRIDVLELDS